MYVYNVLACTYFYKNGDNTSYNCIRFSDTNDELGHKLCGSGENVIAQMCSFIALDISLCFRLIDFYYIRLMCLEEQIIGRI